MKALLITLVIVLIALSVFGIVWWMMNRGSRRPVTHHGPGAHRAGVAGPPPPGAVPGGPSYAPPAPGGYPPAQAPGFPPTGGAGPLTGPVP
ncbi:MAG: hypothetical protein ACRDT4_03795, partial [Micromonosporaceae bacterium]